MTSVSPQSIPALLRLAQISDGIERSWSLDENDHVEERFLLFFAGVDDRANNLATCAQGLGAPTDLLRAWQDAFPRADALGIAVNVQLSSVRLYVQYWDHVAQRVNAGDLSRHPLYIGFKALPDGTVRQDIYQAVPMAPPQLFAPPIVHTLAQFGVAEAKTPQILSGLNNATCIYTEIIGENRASVLATVRRAQPDRAALSEALAQGTGRADHNLRKILAAQASSHDLLHVATGQDPIKGQFATLYFESDGAQLAKSLHHINGDAY